jgi:acetyl esterase/lipase
MRHALAIAGLLVLSIGASAQDAKPAPQPLWPGGAPGAQGKDDKDIPSILLYPASADKANGAAVVVCPGGGYGGLAIDHEGYQIARWLNNLGVTAVILKYRLGPKYRHPIELGDAQRAIRTVRAKAEELKIDPKKIGILGFSAGGHLASTAATHFDAGKADDADSIERASCRPDFLIAIYPVITFEPPHTHMGSRNNLLGKDADPKLIELLSNEKQVTKQTPPTFLAHTSEDTAVPPQNSVLFYLACHKHGVPAELHIYEKGQHGLGLGPRNVAFSDWPNRCEAWLRVRGVLPAAK